MAQYSNPRTEVLNITIPADYQPTLARLHINISYTVKLAPQVKANQQMAKALFEQFTWVTHTMSWSLQDNSYSPYISA